MKNKLYDYIDKHCSYVFPRIHYFHPRIHYFHLHTNIMSDTNEKKLTEEEKIAAIDLMCKKYKLYDDVRYINLIRTRDNVYIPICNWCVLEIAKLAQDENLLTKPKHELEDDGSPGYTADQIARVQPISDAMMYFGKCMLAYDKAISLGSKTGEFVDVVLPEMPEYVAEIGGTSIMTIWPLQRDEWLAKFDKAKGKSDSKKDDKAQKTDESKDTTDADKDTVDDVHDLNKNFAAYLSVEHETQ